MELAAATKEKQETIQLEQVSIAECKVIITSYHSDSELEIAGSQKDDPVKQQAEFSAVIKEHWTEETIFGSEFEQDSSSLNTVQEV